MSILELEDLGYTYPDIDDENFQNLISRKQEFIEVGATVSEKVPKRGQLFRHQKALLRYMKQYDRILVIWDTGAGKSCGVAAVSEYYKTLPNSPYKQAFYLAKGGILLEEFQNQVVCKCTTGEYEIESKKRAKTDMGRQKIINQVFREYYTLVTFEVFAKTLEQKTDEQLIAEYSGSIFIVDEVHNLRVDPDEEKQKKKKKKKGKVGEEDRVTQKLIYKQLYRLFHLIKRSKVMLLSATPMINRSDEIGPLMNLLLPLNKTIPKNADWAKMPIDDPIPKNTDWSQITLDEFEPYLRSYVSYVRALDTGARIIYKGEKMKATYNINGKEVESQIVIYPIEMEPFQEQVYQEALASTDKSTAFSGLERQASNMVFPNGKAGKEGFKEFIKQKTTKVRKIVEGAEILKSVDVPGEYIVEEELKDAFKNPTEFAELSNKFLEIINICKKSKGNCWVFSNFVEGSGAIALSLAFEQNGFTRFKETTSIFETEETGNVSTCQDTTGKRTIKPTFGSKLRYGLLTSETSKTQTSAMLETQNSKENMHGEYLKVMIGSPITREGLNLSNVTTIILVDPHWHNAANYQAISRAIRSTSHVDLIKEAERKGLKVDINIYRMVSEPSEGESIDEHLYQLSESKDLIINRIFTMLKQSAFDCQINYKRNVRTKNERYICSGIALEPQKVDKKVDLTSFDVLYSDEKVDEIKERIKSEFQQVSSINLSALYQYLSEYRPKLIEMAVESLISQREPIINRYGFQTYLRNDKEELFLQKVFPLEGEQTNNDYGLAFYTETLIGLEGKPLSAYVDQFNENPQSEIFEQINALNPKSKDFTANLIALVEQLRQPNKVQLLESALYTLVVDQKTNAFVKAIRNYFDPSILKVHEPVKQIKFIQAELKKPRLGRPSEKGQPNIPVSPEIFVAAGKSQDNFVYLHTLSGYKKKNVSYGETAAYKKATGKLRILKPSEGIWRDLNPAEEILYRAIIEDKILRDLTDVALSSDIYGTILPDKKFRIADIRGVDIKKIKDKRNVPTGQNCSKYDVGKLADILWHLQYNPFEGAKINKSTQDMREFLVRKKVTDVDTLPNEKVKFYYMIYTAKLDKICPLIRDYFAENGMLYVSKFYSQ